MRSRLPSFLVLTIASAFAGCGGDEKADRAPAVSTEQRGVLETVAELQTASRRGDGGRICSQIFTRRLSQSVAAASDTSCAQEVRRDLFSPDTSLSVGRDIRLRGDRAAATVTEGNGKVSVLELRRQAGEWRIDRVRPRT